jgi:hypothetical protein
VESGHVCYERRLPSLTDSVEKVARDYRRIMIPFR